MHAALATDRVDADNVRMLQHGRRAGFVLEPFQPSFIQDGREGKYLQSDAAIERIEQSVLDELVVTDTIPLNPGAQACQRIRQLSVAELMAETIRRIAGEESVSSLYVD